MLSLTETLTLASLGKKHCLIRISKRKKPKNMERNFRLGQEKQNKTFIDKRMDAGLLSGNRRQQSAG